MSRIFRLERTGEQVDLINHSREFVNQHSQKKWDDLKIYVGSDSQNSKYSTNYVACVAYRMGDRGAHVIYTREKLPRIKDRWTRLWKEVEISVEIATQLKDAGVPVFRVDLDFNEKEIARSSDMVKAARGYVIGMGFACEVKPSMLVASRAADHLVRH